MHEVGALLEAKGVHPGRSARDHLLGLAATTGIPVKRVDEVLELVGLTEVARKRARWGILTGHGPAGSGIATPALLGAIRRS